jgi:GNAT superfamily N-acetyltransferase
MGLPVGTTTFRNIELSLKDIESLYPADWAALLTPQWLSIRNTAEVYGLYTDEDLVCIGIVFTDKLPNPSALELTHSQAFSEYNYLGYLYTLSAYRNRGCGSLWIKHLIKLEAYPKLWLTIESIDLGRFYTKNGFVFLNPIIHQAEEYIMYRREGL